jgi:hypothetical protein
MPARALLIVGCGLLLTGLVWLGLMHRSMARMQTQLNKISPVLEEPQP